jgi:hypothetical protein
MWMWAVFSTFRRYMLPPSSWSKWVGRVSVRVYRPKGYWSYRHTVDRPLHDEVLLGTPAFDGLLVYSLALKWAAWQTFPLQCPCRPWPGTSCTFPPMFLLDTRTLINHTHFDPEDWGCMKLRNVDNAAQICTLQRLKNRISNSKPPPKVRN